MVKSYYDEAGNRFEATHDAQSGRWETGYEDAAGVWHKVPPNQMPLEAYTDAQLADLKYSEDGGLSPEQRTAVDAELHDRAVASGQIHTFTDESGNRYEAKQDPESGRWETGYEDAAGVWHEVPPNQMPLEAYTDAQLADLKYSEDGGLSPEQRTAVDAELHDRAVASGQIHTFTDESGNRYEAKQDPESGRWETGYEDAAGVWHEVPPNQMPLEAYTDAQLADLKYSEDGGLSPEQRTAVDAELHDRAVASGQIHTFTDESGNRYEAKQDPESGRWETGYEDAAGVWHEVPPNQMPLEAYTDAQLADLKYSEDGGLSPEQRTAVDAELHDRAVASGQIHTFTDESGNRYEAKQDPESGRWETGYEDAAGVWHEVPPNQMPLEAYTDAQLADLKYSEDGGLSPEQRTAVDAELHDRAVASGQIHTFTDESGNRYEAKQDPESGRWETGYEDAAGVWHEVPPNQMPLEAYTDAQLADLKYSEDGGLSPEQRTAVDAELHDRAMDAGEKVGPGVPTEAEKPDEPEPDVVEDLSPEWIDLVDATGGNTPAELDPFSEAATLWGTVDATREPVITTNETSKANDVLLDDARMFEQAEVNGAAPEPVAAGPDAVVQEEPAEVPDQPLVDDIVMQDAPALREPIVEEEFAGFDEIQTAPSPAADAALIESSASDQGSGEYYPELG